LQDTPGVQNLENLPTKHRSAPPVHFNNSLLVAGLFSEPFCLEAPVGGEFGVVMQSS
jgi:hypothetical protein